jgi:hypothetical protein
MKIKHKHIAAKTTLIFNLFLDSDTLSTEESNKKVNSAKINYEFQDFSHDYKRIKDLKELRSLQKR